MTVGLWRAYEMHSMQASAADALAFKVVRDLFLSPACGLKQADVEQLGQIMARVPAAVTKDGAYEFEAAKFPVSELSVPFGREGLQSEDEVPCVERASTLAMLSLNPRFHASSEFDVEDADGLNSLVEIPHSGALCGQSGALEYDLSQYCDRSAPTRLQQIRAGRPQLQANIVPAVAFHRSSVARDPLMGEIQHPAFRGAIRDHLRSLARNGGRH
jgi:hypothetical protein